MKFTILLFITLSLAATTLGQDHPLARTSPSKTPPFTVDLTEDFHFAFGRGSGQSGLDTISFGRSGVVTLFKQTSGGDWQTATMTLDLQAIKRIFESVRVEGIMKMAAAYHADVADGSQWVIRISQARHTKAIYFNNHFPASVRRFANVIDSELLNAGLATRRWKKVPTKADRQHEKQLWDAIK